MAVIGYARVSTADQNHDLQTQALEKFGCDKIFSDTISGGIAPGHRPGFQKAIKDLEPGDKFVVWTVDRLSRTTVDLLLFLDDLSKRGIEFVSITQGIDTSTPFGRAGLTMLGMFAELERRMISERVRAGQKATGRTGGRPPKLNKHVLSTIKDLRAQGQTTKQISLSVGLGDTTIKRAYEIIDGRTEQQRASMPMRSQT